MKDRIEPVEVSPTDDGKRTKVLISVTTEAAERLLKAFKDGTLAELGILDLKLLPSETPAQSEKKWRAEEIDKRMLKSDGTPTLP